MDTIVQDGPQLENRGAILALCSHLGLNILEQLGSATKVRCGGGITTRAWAHVPTGPQSLLEAGAAALFMSCSVHLVVASTIVSTAMMSGRNVRSF